MTPEAPPGLVCAQLGTTALTLVVLVHDSLVIQPPEISKFKSDSTSRRDGCSRIGTCKHGPRNSWSTAVHRTYVHGPADVGADAATTSGDEAPAPRLVCLASGEHATVPVANWRDGAPNVVEGSASTNVRLTQSQFWQRRSPTRRCSGIRWHMRSYNAGVVGVPSRREIVSVVGNRVILEVEVGLVICCKTKDCEVCGMNGVDPGPL